MSIVMEHLTDITLWEGNIYILPDSPFVLALKRVPGFIAKAQIYTSSNNISRITIFPEDGKPEVSMTVPAGFLKQCIVKLDSPAAKLLYTR
jgi:hypothetical protein